MRAAALMAALLVSSIAHATESVRLEFERTPGAESCPDRETFEAIVGARLGRTDWDDRASRVVRVVFGRHRDGELLGRMELLEGGAVLGVRDVRDGRRGCNEIAETLGLSVALAIDPPGRPRGEPREAPESSALLDALGTAATPVDASVWDALAPPPAPIEIEREEEPVVAAPSRALGRPIPVMLFAGSEGAYSWWSGGSKGGDEHHQSVVLSGDLSAGGEAPMGRGYTLEVLVTGYGAQRRDRRMFMDLEQHGRGAAGSGSLYADQSIGATAMRTAFRFDGEEAAVSLGVLVGGFRQQGCHHERVRGWQSPLCRDLQRWAAFPTFGARMGPSSGPYATLGVLDGRTIGGELAHLGVGAVLPGDRRIDTSFVAAVEGVGLRLSIEAPIGRELVIMPSISGGILYDTFTEGGRNNWVRAGCAIGIRR